MKKACLPLGKTRIWLWVLGLFFMASAAPAAEKYPTKPVVIIVPFQAGGPVNIDARILAVQLPKFLGQQVLVQDFPGTGSVAGTLEVIKSKPDGHTLLMTGNSILTSSYLLAAAPSPWELEPIAQVVRYPKILAVSTKSGFKNLAEMVDFAKKNPKRLLVGINPGAVNQLDTVAIMKALGIEPNYVPFKGSGERTVALAGGHLQASLDSLASIRSYIDAQKLRPVAITSRERAEAIKEIPTFVEQGAQVEIYVWEGFFAPKGISAEVRRTLEGALEKALKEKAVLDQLEKSSVKIVFLKGKEFRDFLEKEEARVKSLTQELGLSKK